MTLLQQAGSQERRQAAQTDQVRLPRPNEAEPEEIAIARRGRREDSGSHTHRWSVGPSIAVTVLGTTFCPVASPENRGTSFIFVADRRAGSPGRLMPAAASGPFAVAKTSRS